MKKRVFPLGTWRGGPNLSNSYRLIPVHFLMKAVEAVKVKFDCFLGIVHPTHYQSRGWGPWLVYTWVPRRQLFEIFTPPITSLTHSLHEYQCMSMPCNITKCTVVGITPQSLFLICTADKQARSKKIYFRRNRGTLRRRRTFEAGNCLVFGRVDVIFVDYCI